jgi:hypothetical protein
MNEIEMLMKPRFKVTADYPYNPHQIGEVIEFTDNGRAILTVTNEWVDGENINMANYATSEVFLKYPHLFKKLEWWEDNVFKVVSNTDSFQTFKDGTIPLRFIHPINYHYEPATKEQYEAQTR